jgi:hypothetical protein
MNYQIKVGGILKSQRKYLKISIEQASDATKIRPEYLIAMEDGEFGFLKSKVYAREFVKSYAKFLDLDTDKVLALYRREQDLPVSVKQPQITSAAITKMAKVKSLVYSRSFLFAVSGIFLAGLIAIYLFGQVQSLFSPPKLLLTSPLEIEAGFSGDIYVAGNSFKIEGETDSQTVITFNSEVLALEPGNIFSTPEIPLKTSRVVAILTATNQFGQVSTIRLNILRGGTGVADVNKMTVLIEVEGEVTPVLVRSDGKIVFNERAFVGDLIQTTAENSLQIESEKPYNLKVTINGEVFKFTERNKIWELIDGNIVQKAQSK